MSEENFYVEQGIEPPTREELVGLLEAGRRLQELLEAYCRARYEVDGFPSGNMADFCSDLLIENFREDRIGCRWWDDYYNTLDEVQVSIEDLLDVDFTRLRAELDRWAELERQRQAAVAAARKYLEDQERQRLRELLEKNPDEKGLSK